MAKDFKELVARTCTPASKKIAEHRLHDYLEELRACKKRPGSPEEVAALIDCELYKLQELMASTKDFDELAGSLHHSCVYIRALLKEPLARAVPLADLVWSRRAVRLFTVLRLKTLGQLAKLTEEAILAVPKIGVGTVQELRRNLLAYGLQLRGD